LPELEEPQAEEGLPCPIKIRKELTTIALRAHDQRGSLQLIDLDFAIGNLPKLHAVLPERVFEFGQTELHVEELGSKSFAKAIGLLRRFPVSKVRQSTRRVFDDDVVHAILKTVGPRKNALDTSRVQSNYANRRELGTGGSEVLVHRIEPVGRNLASASSHIGKDDRGTAVEMVDEGIEPGGRVNVDLSDRTIEEVLQGATGFVFGIEIEQRDGNLVGPKPLGESDHDAGFTDAAFATDGDFHTGNVLKGFQFMEIGAYTVAGTPNLSGNGLI
jgi:hypothetical protein